MWVDGFLQRCHPSGVFYSTETRAGEGRETGNLWSAPKTNRAIHFFQKKQIEHVSQPTFSKVGHAEEVQVQV